MIAALVYPHQLWENNPAVIGSRIVVLVEDPLFFSQYNFHAQKLILHRASMTEFSAYCHRLGKQVHRIEAHQLVDTCEIGTSLKNLNISRALGIDPTDVWLKDRVDQGCRAANVAIEWLEDPAFLTPAKVMQSWTENRQHFHFTEFYREQRKRLGVLLDSQGKPLGGKWTFDTENRKRLPRDIAVPAISRPIIKASVVEAQQYVAKNFPNALGQGQAFNYAVTHEDARFWLNEFVASRLAAFGDYEDAISASEVYLFHSLLTPMLNIGLLTPQQVVDAVLAHRDEVPLNSLEGFIRQVIGWREFVRLVYVHAGIRQRTRNFWGLSQKLPASFYSGTTGIAPFDASVERTLKHAYCHHIERLMILGNFMLLCDIAPDVVYQWFMEMFIDSYDWVMVPNVYGMSQHADGGLMTTKPYISGSSYILKMSDYPKGPWTAIWDGLYWRFIHRQREFFRQNPRMRVMVGQLDRMGNKLDQHLVVAERFLETMHG